MGNTVFVAGHKGLVGSAVVRELKNKGAEIITRTREELNLLDQEAVRGFFFEHRPDYVVLAAAKVGGILANSIYPASFIYENLTIQANVLHAASSYDIKRMVVLGSSCIYPKMCPQPIKEEYLLTGPLEPTNEAYAVAKIAGLKMAEFYHKQYGMNTISLMPTNLYGVNDNFDLTSSHVLPALIRRFYTAKLNGDKQVTCLGTGSPRREFLYVDDLARAISHVLYNYNGNELLNVGTGEDVTIKEAAEMVAKTVGYEGDVVWDHTKPDGTPRKVLDVSRIQATGWKSEVSLEEGLKRTVEWYAKSISVSI
jgi:GDP-L-fucose synthase